MNIFEKIEQKIFNSVFIKFLSEKSKLFSLPGFRGVSFYEVWMFFWKQVHKIGMTERASAIAFNFTMAIPPAIIFIFTLVPFMPISKEFIEQMFTLIRDVIPGQKDNSPLIAFLNDFINRPRNGLLSLGFILSLFFSSSAMMGIMRSFDKNYIGFNKRSDFHNRLIAIRLTLIFYVLILIAIFIIAMQGQVLHWLDIKNKTAVAIILNLRWFIIILLFFYIISFIYKYAPAVHKKWKLINPGSILATFLMLLFTMFFSWWINNYANYNQLYGPISTVLILMLLIYFNSLVLLIGFELNVSISSLKKIADEREKNNTDGDGISA
jgi:membrane protein